MAGSPGQKICKRFYKRKKRAKAKADYIDCSVFNLSGYDIQQTVFGQTPVEEVFWKTSV